MLNHSLLVFICQFIKIFFQCKCDILDEGEKDYYEGFIVEDKGSTKRDVMAFVPKPSTGSMALTFTPKNKTEIKANNKDIAKVAQHGIDTSTARHIDPKINLKKTLTILNDSAYNKKDGPGKVRNNKTKINIVHPSPGTHSAMGATFIQRYSNNAPSLLIKKEAKPNILTNATVQGFLSKDKNYTLKNVGNPKQVNGTKKSQKPDYSAETKQAGDQEHTITRYIDHFLKMKVNVMKHADTNQDDGKNKTKTELSNYLIQANYSSQKDTNKTTNATIIKTFDNSTSSTLSQVNASSDAKNGSKVIETYPNISKTSNEVKKVGDLEVNHPTKSSGTTKVHTFDPEEFTRLQKTNELETSANDEKLRKDEVDKHPSRNVFVLDVECSDKKKCPDGKYCRDFVCHPCHRKHHECTNDTQCCENMPCVYGRCDTKPKGSPGTICDSDKDCGDDGCCVIEPTIDEYHGICKRKLAEYHQCSPVLFRKVWLGDKKPECGPCKKGLQCVEKGITASHLICMKKIVT